MKHTVKVSLFDITGNELRGERTFTHEGSSGDALAAGVASAPKGAVADVEVTGAGGALARFRKVLP
jgi:hypothetical protein